MRFNASGWITTKNKSYVNTHGRETVYSYAVYAYRIGKKERCIRLKGNQQELVTQALSDRKSIQEIKELLTKQEVS